MIKTVSDVSNGFLSRRELVCDFDGLGGKLKKLEAVDMVSKEFDLGGKTVIPVSMRSHVGKPLVTGTFYIYEDEELAKRQVSPVIMSRLDRANKKIKEAEEAAAKAAEEAKAAEAEAAEESKEADAGEKEGGEEAKEAEAKAEPEKAAEPEAKADAGEKEGGS